MTNDNDTLPQSTAELTSLVRELQAKVEQQSLFVDQLLEQIRLAGHQHFGARSERFSIDQLALAFDRRKLPHCGKTKTPVMTISVTP